MGAAGGVGSVGGVGAAGSVVAAGSGSADGAGAGTVAVGSVVVGSVSGVLSGAGKSPGLMASLSGMAGTRFSVRDHGKIEPYGVEFPDFDTRTAALRGVSSSRSPISRAAVSASWGPVRCGPVAEVTRKTNNPRAEGLGAQSGAGDENRTRALSLGSDGAWAGSMDLASTDTWTLGGRVGRVAPLANLHDSQALIPLVRGIPPIRSRRGPRRRRPGKLHGDKGYDYLYLRRWLASRGIRHRLARRGIESSRHLGRHRWVVERTMSWLSGCRRLHRRYERKPEHFLAFTATLIYHRILTNCARGPRAVRKVPYGLNDGPRLQALRTGHGVMVAYMHLRPSGSEPFGRDGDTLQPPPKRRPPTARPSDPCLTGIPHKDRPPAPSPACPSSSRTERESVTRGSPLGLFWDIRLHQLARA